MLDKETTFVFDCVKFGQRPLMAIPLASQSIRRAAIHCFPRHTLKKRIVRSVVGAVDSLKIGGFFWNRSETPISGVSAEKLRGLLRLMQADIGIGNLYPVLIWPGDANRGRIYLHWLDDHGTPQAFGKLGLDSKNGELIRNEQRALELLNAATLRNFRVPRLRGFGEASGCVFLDVEVVPQTARITHWKTDAPISECVAEYAGAPRRMSFAELEEQAWWQCFSKNTKINPLFKAEVQKNAECGIDVCRVHGDLNQTNVLRAEKSVWLLDWERSCEAGPCLTDVVCMEVDRLWPVIQRNAEIGLQKFLDQLWRHSDSRQQSRVLLALAFLCAADFTPVTTTVQAWKNI